MNPKVHGYVFCSTLQFTLWYRALVSSYTEERTGIASDQEASAFESKEGKTVEEQPLLIIETKTLHYTRAVGS